LTSWCNCVEIPQTSKSLNGRRIRKTRPGRVFNYPSTWGNDTKTMSPSVIGRVMNFDVTQVVVFFIIAVSSS
jgi:hypothetical protein